MGYRFHILGLPHTVSSPEYSACAYTQKVVKFGKMMKARGHEIIHYGHEESSLICDEHVTVTTNKDLEIAYGTYDWRKNFFTFDVQDHAYKTFYANAIREVEKRKKKYDFILPFWGSGGRPVCDAHNDLIVVEPGIGYAGGHWANWKIFESYAILHAYYGLAAVGTCMQKWYDVVIPNYFDLEEFTYSDKKDDYFLFTGRVYEGKGIDIAVQVTEKIGAKLIVAGQNPEERTFPPHVEFVGYVGIEERKKLMSKAKASFVASTYLEPFGGVQVENLLSGTPTITTDWGAFTENNINGFTGYRCRTFKEFVEAAQNIDKIKSEDCRRFGEQFSLENIAPKYEKYFDDVMNVYRGEGWYQMTPLAPYDPDKVDLNYSAREQRPFAKNLSKCLENEDIFPRLKKGRPRKVTNNGVKEIRFTFSRIFQVGCGLGVYLEALAERGFRVGGCDDDERLIGHKLNVTEEGTDSELFYHISDLSKWKGEMCTVDMVICLEVAHKIPPDRLSDFLTPLYNTISVGGYLLFSAAQPGQGDLEHHNYQSPSYWENIFVNTYSMNRMHSEEKVFFNELRKGRYMGWFMNNAMLFYKAQELPYSFLENTYLPQRK